MNTDNNNKTNDEDIKAPKSMKLAKDLLGEYVSAMEDRLDGVKHHVESGFDTVDHAFGGWLHEGHLIIVAGRPGMGKTVFSQQVAEYIAIDKTAFIFTLEMSGYEVTERSLSRRSGVSIPRLKMADEMNSKEWDRFTVGASDYSKLNLLVDDGAFELAEIVNKAKNASTALAAKGLPPLGVIMVDYLQLISSKAANRNLEVGQISRALKKLSKELKVPVIAISQLNRGVEGRNDKRPTMSDLRESGAIEQDADLIIGLYRDDYYHDDSDAKGMAEIIVLKNRHGATGSIVLEFIGERVCFKDVTYD